MEHTKNITNLQSITGDGVGWPVRAFQALNASFLDEGVCIRWIIRELHSPVIKCPRCSMIILDSRRLRRFWSVERIRCERCGAFFTALTDTIFSGCHLGLREIYLMLVLLDLGVKDKIIAEKLKVSQEAIRLWRKKLSGGER